MPALTRNQAKQIKTHRPLYDETLERHTSLVAKADGTFDEYRFHTDPDILAKIKKFDEDMKRQIDNLSDFTFLQFRDLLHTRINMHTVLLESPHNFQFQIKSLSIVFEEIIAWISILKDMSERQYDRLSTTFVNKANELLLEVKSKPYISPALNTRAIEAINKAIDVLKK